MPDPFLLLRLSAISLLFLTSLVDSLTLSSDIAALKAFKASINPATIQPFACLGSWNFSTDPCANPRRVHFTCGVNCDDTPAAGPSRVTQITLDPAGYSGTLSPEVGKLTRLTVLDLSNNYFFGPIPSSLSSLSNLQTLVLHSNSFSGAVPASLCNLKSLQSLDLSRNSLSGPLPRYLSSLIGLRRLDLSFNRLTGSLPRLPPNLLELALKANSLSGSLYKSSFDGLTQLEVVELSDNSLSGTVEGWFFLLQSLQQVDLANNTLARVEIWSPGKFNGDLVAVDLGFNRIEGNIPANFSAYPSLSSLSLRYNRLRGPIPWEFGKKESLKRLFLDGNYLNGTPPQGLFSSETSVSGSLGDNCLQSCPVSSQLCLKSQKPLSICRQAYGGKPRS
ncbi:LRR receptor-like serine/threonine-protein kinase GHR1 [Diospyros lotus]|uniref:LRR receptor-like serine/threonine-protein kinase GHR1 n=1 Tax=Diospyros lotus TaxID=55363 RepID=UPI00225266F7|nr:LRR receptor-like serine/threonine-protein kinase GHR1 [Diospyros lotus]